MTAHVKWWNRLSTQLSTAVVLVSVAAIGIFAVVAVRNQERSALDEVSRASHLLSSTISQSIYHHMLEDRRQDAYLSMESIASQPAIERVRMLNREGVVTFSRDSKEVGHIPDRDAESCNQCHAGNQPLGPCQGPNTTRVFRSEKGHRILGVVTPVRNEPACSSAACHAHSANDSILGVIDVAISLEESDARTGELTRTTLGLAALAALAIGLLVSLLSRLMVLKPLRELSGGIRRVHEQDFEQPIAVHGMIAPTEIGYVAASFNEMTGALRQARADRTQLLESLEAQVQERTRDLKSAQEQLIQSEKMSSLGKLSASIAHEINNPLMGILTVSKLLQRLLEGKPLDEAGKAQFGKNLKMVQRETERCSAIVRNLLDFARQRPLTLKQLDLNLALEEALSVAANQMALQQVKLTSRLGQGVTVQADLGQLRQAFLNVVMNAIEAMPKGGELTVESRLLEDRTVQVEVRDTGCGIPEELLGKILDPFFTTKEKGTGLGLSVVYGIVQRHGGKLEVKSEVGVGTRVIISLPQAMGEPPPV